MLEEWFCTFFTHAHGQAFLQSAVLAPVPGVLLDGTGPAAPAGIAGVGPDATPEEALAGLAALHAKVVARGGVVAHPADGLLHAVVQALLGCQVSLGGLWVVEHVVHLAAIAVGLERGGEGALLAGIAPLGVVGVKRLLLGLVLWAIRVAVAVLLLLLRHRLGVLVLHIACSRWGRLSVAVLRWRRVVLAVVRRGLGVPSAMPVLWRRMRSPRVAVLLVRERLVLHHLNGYKVWRDGHVASGAGVAGVAAGRRGRTVCVSLVASGIRQRRRWDNVVTIVGGLVSGRHLSCLAQQAKHAITHLAFSALAFQLFI